jgi:hypothetical protein
VDLPLCMATTGSLLAFYMLAESAQGRKRRGALAKLPMLIAIGTGLAPHLSVAVWEGLRSMAGEFVRTPKQGNNKNRYKAAFQLPYIEALLALWSGAAVVASFYTGHYFATPFAVLFTMGYGYVTVLLTREQILRSRPIEVAPAVVAPVMATPALAAHALLGPELSLGLDGERDSDVTALRSSDVPESGERLSGEVQPAHGEAVAA